VQAVINTKVLDSLWADHTDDVPVVFTGRVHHMGDADEYVEIEFHADSAGFAWHGYDTSTGARQWSSYATASTTAMEALAGAHAAGSLPISYRMLLDVCSAVDELAESWRYRPDNLLDQATTPERTRLRILYLDSARTIGVVLGVNGYVHAGVRDQTTGIVAVEVSPTRSLSRALSTPRDRAATVAQALTDDALATPEEIRAAGWLSPPHAALAFLHPNCENPWQFRRLLSQDAHARRVLHEGFVDALLD
jgi:hypothetical protein